MLEVFRFENLAPTTEPDVWQGDVVVDVAEYLGETKVVGTVRATVRFRCEDTRRADELLQSAYGQAKYILASAAGVLDALPFEIAWRDRQNRNKED
jgi:hypothetical protein